MVQRMTTGSMIHSRTTAALRALGSGLLILGVVGCASSGPKRSEKAVETMAETHEGLTKVRSQIDRTLASLSSVMSASPDQLRSSFDRYAKDVDALRKEAASTKKRFESMKAKKDRYLEQWEKDKSQVKNEELRQIADSRRAEQKASFERAIESLQIANETFDPFMSNLDDVKKVLGNDLTPTGQALVANTAVVQNANDRGARVAQSIDAALVEVASMAAQLSPTGEMKK